MDPKTLAVLKRIQANVPEHLKNNLTKLVIDTSEEEVAMAALTSPKISKKKKLKLQEMLNAGKFRREETVVNEETVKAIDEYYTTEINKAIASGEIPDPKDDPYIQERRRREGAVAEQRLIKSIGGDATPPVIKSTLKQ